MLDTVKEAKDMNFTNSETDPKWNHQSPTLIVAFHVQYEV